MSNKHTPPTSQLPFDVVGNMSFLSSRPMPVTLVDTCSATDAIFDSINNVHYNRRAGAENNASAER